MALLKPKVVKCHEENKRGCAASGEADLGVSRAATGKS